MDRRLESLDVQVHSLGLIVHLCTEQHLSLECIDDKSCEDTSAFGDRKTAKNGLDGHIIRCFCRQEMIYHLFVGKKWSRVLVWFWWSLQFQLQLSGTRGIWRPFFALDGQRHCHAPENLTEVIGCFERVQECKDINGDGCVEYLIPHLDLNLFLYLKTAFGDVFAIRSISVDRTVSATVQCIRK